MVRKLSGAFTGGVVGALIDSVNVWLLSHFGLLAMAGISMRVEFVGSWLYPRLVWGGIWALLLLLPILKKKVALRGTLMSLFPSAMMLFKVLPAMGQGLMGLHLGILMPVMVVTLNFIYGLVAAFWYKNSGG